MFVALGEPDKALFVARHAARRHPNAIESWQRLAETAVDLGRLDIAREAAQRALEIDPNDVATQELLLRIQ